MMRKQALASGLVLFLLAFGCTQPDASDVMVVTWNVREGFTPEDIHKRSRDFQDAGAALKPGVLILQEVCSYEVVEAIRAEMGLDGYFIACTDFAPDRDKFNSLEVAIVSRYPFGEIVEYDANPDGRVEGSAIERPLPSTESIGIANENVGRGYLWATIPELKFTVVAVHLKSSRGDAGRKDAENAAKRERVIGAVALGVLADQSERPDYTCIVAGDFNVGHSDTKKCGHDLVIDGFDPQSGRDLYDETHAILKDGIVRGLKMRNLAADIYESTYPSFPGTPIDNIYVIGPGESRFSGARRANQQFGSDHLAVWTKYHRN